MKERKENLNEIAVKFDLDIIYTFGSHAKEVLEWIEGKVSTFSVAPLSDVDIGVKPSLKIGFSVKEKVHLASALEDLFEVNRVDLVVIPEADPFLAANIIRGERIYSKDEHEADEYDLYILRRAGDLVPLERERIDLIMRREE